MRVLLASQLAGTGQVVFYFNKETMYVPKQKLYMLSYSNSDLGAATTLLHISFISAMKRPINGLITGGISDAGISGGIGVTGIVIPTWAYLVSHTVIVQHITDVLLTHQEQVSFSIVVPTMLFNSVYLFHKCIKSMSKVIYN